MLLTLPSSIVVTGAGSGIGRAVVREVLRHGSRCIALDKDPVGLQDLTHTSPTDSLFVRRCDITDGASLERTLAEVEELVGPTDGLVHAAGVLSSKSLLDPDLSVDEFRTVQRVNLEGSWIVGRSLGLRFRDRRRGALVFISSNAGTTPRTNMGAYCASKAGVTMLARCLALELGASGVRCNVVSPGSTDTPMLRSLLGERTTDSLLQGDLETFRTGIPLGRVGQPNDVAATALYLLSDGAAHITGWDVRVDGGATWS